MLTNNRKRANVTTLELIHISNIKMVDIAKRAGVSIATVGRVIHKKGYVSEQYRKEIERIIEETGYVPNKMAQGLKYSRSKLIGLLTPFGQNMLFEQITQALEMSAREKGYNILTLKSHRNMDEERLQIDELIGLQVDGVIISTNFTMSQNSLEKFTKAGIPVVMYERTRMIPGVDCVEVDDFYGSYQAVRHILDKGHRRIGFIGKKNWHEVETNRYNGYCKALSDMGIAIDESIVYAAEDYSVDEGKIAIAKLLAQKDKITALFMTADTFACGVMQYCYKEGIRIPDDLSLIGYDNTLSTLLSPPISSMGLPCEDFGKTAIDLLIDRRSNMNSISRKSKIKPVLVDRGTVREIK